MHDVGSQVSGGHGMRQVIGWSQRLRVSASGPRGSIRNCVPRLSPPFSTNEHDKCEWRESAVAFAISFHENKASDCESRQEYSGSTSGLRGNECGLMFSDRAKRMYLCSANGNYLVRIDYVTREGRLS